MHYLDDESYLCDMLLKKRLISSEQRKLIFLKKDQQRQYLIRKQRGDTPGLKQGEYEKPDMVDIIVCRFITVLRIVVL